MIPLCNATQSFDGEVTLAQTRDEMLKQIIHCSLSQTGYTYFRKLDVSVSSGIVTLEGLVPSYYMKQKAQAAVLAVAAVVALKNNLLVGKPSERAR
ncbi:MAG: BON domain-containing protein [Planctomycetes bacterium]|nr:BON domain-containing protein [Planctomycetota bacterium]